MANPTFNGVALTHAAARTQIGSRRPRMYIETMPGVDGEFAQACGHAGRDIEVTGLLVATGALPAHVRDEAMSAFRQIEAMADGVTVAIFVGSDEYDYSNCMLTACTHGRLRIAADGKTAYLPVRAQLRQLTP